MTDCSVDSVPLGESIGENLARLRKVRDLSQERLAEAADVGVDTVARLEQAKRSNVRPVTLRKLADALGVSVDDLIGRPSARPSEEIDITGLRRAITADGAFRSGDGGKTWTRCEQVTGNIVGLFVDPTSPRAGRRCMAATAASTVETVNTHPPVIEMNSTRRRWST